MTTDEEQDQQAENVALALSRLSSFHLTLIGIAIALLFALLLLGWGALTTLVVFLVFMVVPFYGLLEPFGLSTEERAVYSLFFGIGIFPLVVYWLYNLIGSLLWTSISTVVGLYAVSIYLVMRSRKKKKQ